MNRFFQWLDSRRPANPGRAFHDDAAPEDFAELRRLWEISSKTNAPPPPDEEEAWRSVRHSLRSAQHEQPHPVIDLWRRFARPLIVRPVLSSACAAAAAVAFVLWLNLSPLTYRAGELGTVTVTLPDSSVVTLGRSSLLSYHRGFTGGVRRAELEGEAYFTVTRRREPFIVETPLGSVHVVGTRFDVRCDSALYVAVTRGVVTVATHVCAADSAVTLHAGEYMRCARDGAREIPGRSIPHDIPVWMGGAMSLTHADLRSVCDELSRQLGVSVTVAPGAPDSLRVTGVLAGNDADQVLLVLSTLTGTHISHESRGYVVY